MLARRRRSGRWYWVASAALSLVAEYLVEVEHVTLRRWKAQAFWHLRALCVANPDYKFHLRELPRLVRFRELVVSPTPREARERRRLARNRIPQDERDHDWKLGMRLGEAKRPGPLMQKKTTAKRSSRAQPTLHSFFRATTSVGRVAEQRNAASSYHVAQQPRRHVQELVCGEQRHYEGQRNAECAAHALNNLFAYTWVDAVALLRVWAPPLSLELLSLQARGVPEGIHSGFVPSTVAVALRLRGATLAEWPLYDVGVHTAKRWEKLCEKGYGCIVHNYEHRVVGSEVGGHYVAVVPLPDFGYRFIDSVGRGHRPGPTVVDFADSTALCAFMLNEADRWRAVNPEQRSGPFYTMALEIQAVPACFPRGNHLRVVARRNVGSGCAIGGCNQRRGSDRSSNNSSSGSDSSGSSSSGDGDHGGDGSACSNDSDSDCSSDSGGSDLNGFIVQDGASDDDSSGGDVNIFEYINSVEHPVQYDLTGTQLETSSDASAADSYFATQVCMPHTVCARDSV